jgi:cytochrome b subunit of formate dehydrogenase
MSGRTFTDHRKDKIPGTGGIQTWIFINVAVLIALGSGLFLALGRIDWQPGWMYLGVIIAGQLATTLLLFVTNPTLLGERSWVQPGSKSWDQMIVSTLDVSWLGVLIVVGLSHRLDSSPHPAVGVTGLGWVFLILGYLSFL